jgi:hypothetical protein
MENGACKLCGYAEETTYHTLIQCDNAKQFWSAALDQLELKFPNLHPMSWMWILSLGASFFNNKDERAKFQFISTELIKLSSTNAAR